MKTNTDIAAAHYKVERAKPGNVLEALQAAREFVDRHTEPWYFSGNQLLGKIDAAIEVVTYADDYAKYLEACRLHKLKPLELAEYVLRRNDLGTPLTEKL